MVGGLNAGIMSVQPGWEKNSLIGTEPLNPRGFCSETEIFADSRISGMLSMSSLLPEAHQNAAGRAQSPPQPHALGVVGPSQAVSFIVFAYLQSATDGDSDTYGSLKRAVHSRT